MTLLKSLMTFTASMFFASSVIAQDTPQTVEVRWWVGNHSEGAFRLNVKVSSQVKHLSAQRLL